VFVCEDILMQRNQEYLKRSVDTPERCLLRRCAETIVEGEKERQKEQRKKSERGTKTVREKAKSTNYIGCP
jgi:hypothetical protein